MTFDGSLPQVGQYREGVGVEWTGEAIPSVPRRTFQLSEPLVANRPHTIVHHQEQVVVTIRRTSTDPTQGTY